MTTSPIRDIALYLLDDDFPEGSDFEFRAHHIGNYLRRRAIADKYRGEGYSRLFVRGQRQPEKYFFESKILIAPVVFDPERYEVAWGDGTDREAFSEYVFDLFRHGFSQAAAAGAPIPLELLEGYMKDFRQGGYTNSWVHSAKLFRALGVHATLECSLDSIRFSLVLVIREGSAKGPHRLSQTDPQDLAGLHYLLLALQGGCCQEAQPCRPR